MHNTQHLLSNTAKKEEEEEENGKEKEEEKHTNTQRPSCYSGQHNSLCFSLKHYNDTKTEKLHRILTE